MRLKALLIALCLAGTAALAPPLGAQSTAPQTTPVQPPGPLPTLAPLVKATTPAVVNISVVSRGKLEDNPLYNDPLFRRFFSDPRFRQQQPQGKPTQAAGSGVIVDAQRGYVITNHHVVDKADEVRVTLKDGRSLRAQVIGSDAETDIAVLRIPAEGLTALALGDSDRVEVGDYVVAIGNPFGLGQTVTMGIVSALGRTGLGIEGYEDFIQTDASINPGNSGGALINLRGELVGINTAILAPTGGNVGIGFAVPINMARSVVAQITEHGTVQRGRLGVSIQDITPEIAQAMNLPRLNGALIASVEPGSAAEKAGLKRGDVVLAVAGIDVRNASDLRNRIGLVRAGQEVDMTYRRDSVDRTVRVHVQAQVQPPAPVDQGKR